jgi:YbbR domain-containing protein
MFERLTRRWHLKLLSLGLAFAVWVAVTGEGRSVQDFSVPVEVSLGPKTTLAGPTPLKVNVRLRAPESILRRIDPYDLDVRVDLRDAPPGERTVSLGPRLVGGVPTDVEIVQVEPDRLKLNLARKVRREVPVVPTISGRPPRGYAFYRAIPNPDGLQVEGPESRLGNATRVRTDPILVDGRRESFLARVAPVAESADVTIADARPLDVRVFIDLAPVDVTIPRVPVVVADGSGTASVSSVSVTVSAPSALVATLRSGNLRAMAEAAGDARSVPLRIELTGLDDDARAKITVKSVTPRTVDLRRAR